MEQAESQVWHALQLARLAHVGGASWLEIRDLPAEQLARDIDHTLLVGGMSRVPLVRESLAKLLSNARIHDSVGVAADEAIVADLPDTGGYNTVNVYRPALDIELTWAADQHVSFYEAYTPLFENRCSCRGGQGTKSLTNPLAGSRPGTTSWPAEPMEAESAASPTDTTTNHEADARHQGQTQRATGATLVRPWFRERGRTIEAEGSRGTRWLAGRQVGTQA